MKHIKIVALSLGILFMGVVGWWVVSSRQASPPQDNPPSTETKQVFSASEVATHNVKDDCWTIIDETVYDLTTYVNRHPGGEELLRACGQDATTLFTERRTQEGLPVGSGSPHSPAADQQLKTLKIGIKE